MADSKINISIVLNQDGSLKKASSDMEKLNTSEKKLNKTRKETKKTTKDATKGHELYDKQNKSVYQGNLSSAKSFSKMNQTIGTGSSGLVAAYATLAANVFAATAAFNALKSAAQVQQLIKGLEALGAASGKNLGLLAEKVRDAAGGAIALDQALRTASVGASAGFNSDQIAGLAEVARNAAVALGRDVGDAVDRLTRGAAKLEPEILDELGIFVRLDDASAKYAASLGVGTSELTRFQQRQAFTNEILAQGADKFSALEGEVEASSFDQLAATLGDLSRTMMDFFNSVLSPLAGFLANNTVALAGLFAIITKGILNQALPVLNEFAARSKAAADLEISRARVTQLRLNKEIQGQRNVLKPIKNSTLEYNKLFGKIKQGTATTDELNRAEQSLAKSIRARQNALSRGKAETRAARQAEIDMVKQQQRELQKLMQMEKQRAGKEGSIQLLTAKSRGKRSEQAVFRELDKDQSFKGYMRAFGLADLASKKYKKNLGDAATSQKIFGLNLGFLGKALNGARVPMFKFGLTAKIAIKGIFTAIPVIGQLLLVVDLLIAGLKKAIGFFAGFGKEATEAEKAADAFSSQIEFYTKTLGNANNEIERQADALKIAANAQAELNTTSNRLSDTNRKSFEEASAFGQALIILGTKLEVIGMKIGRFFTVIFEFIQIQILKVQRAFNNFIANNIGLLNGLIRVFNATFAEEGQEVALLNAEDFTANANKITDEIERINNVAKRRLSADNFDLLGSFVAVSPELKALSTTLLATGKSSEELVKFLGTDNMNDFVTSVKAAQDATNGLQVEFKDGKPVYDGIIQQLSGHLSPALAQSAAGFISVDENGVATVDTLKLLSVALEEGTKNTVTAGKAVEELENQFKNSGEKFDEFFTGFRKKAAFTPVLSELNTMSATIDEIAKGDGGFAAIEESFAKAPASLKKVVNNALILKGVLDEKGQIVKVDGETEEEQAKRIGKLRKTEIEDLQSLVRLIQEAQIFDSTRLRVLQQQENAIKKAGKANAAAVSAEIALSNARANIEITNLKNNNTLREQELGLSAGQVYNQEELAKLGEDEKEKYGALLESRQQLAETEERLIGQKEEQALVDKAILELDKRRFALTQAQQQADAKVLATSQKIANVKSGRGGVLTAAEQLRAQKLAADNAIANAQREKELLEEKFRIEKLILKARLTAARVSETSINEIVEALDKQLEIEQKIADAKITAAKADRGAVGVDGAGLLGDSAGFTAVDAVSKAGESLIGLKDEEGNDRLASTQEKLSALSDATKPMRDALIALGPEGEAVATAQQGLLTIASAFDVITDTGNSTQDRLAAVGAAIGAVSQIMAANSKAQIAEIDNQIAAEKKRDGKSAESVAKIAAMEKKKEAIARKQFERNKKMQMAQTVVNTASAVVAALDDLPFPANVALAVMMGAMGAAQLAIISKQQFQGGAGTDIPKPNTALSIGKRSNAVDVSRSATGGELNYLRGGRTTGQNLGGAGASFPGGAMGRKGYADGGEGIVVGERGPEVITPAAPIDITPNFALGGGETNVNFTINAVDAAGVEDVLMNQRGNLIRMIREAANENGERFLETIDTQSYGSSS